MEESKRLGEASDSRIGGIEDLGMWGRFTLITKKAALAEQFPLFAVPDLEPRYNIAPTQGVPAARIPPDGLKREIVPLRWGLVPSWADDPAIGNRPLNARSETDAEKPSFRAAFRKRGLLESQCSK